MGPKYDGKYLRSLINGLLGDLTIKQTLTHVIIPTFDIKLLQPVIFNTIEIWSTIIFHCIFQSTICDKHYLRIQDDTLTGDVSSVDIATKENLQKLVNVGENLLKKPLSRVNLESGKFEPVDDGTNEEALFEFAKMLSEERKLRLPLSLCMDFYFRILMI
ncbi:patatin-like protein 3 [Momordica charantia]|uniref:Patatin-like protein 3 n=1 Tax=Momordica charantia TaxID=3673 RepID=A0A6J1DYT4_MOMCH|nr:patatin-like protein 3 [Momordica charantia]